MTFGNSRARAISLEYKNTMFKYIYTLKCGGKKNIYFTEHDIYFTKLMFILKNINLELKSALRTKYIFYRFLLYPAMGDFNFGKTTVLPDVVVGALVVTLGFLVVAGAAVVPEP